MSLLEISHLLKLPKRPGYELNKYIVAGSYRDGTTK